MLKKIAAFLIALGVVLGAVGLAAGPAGAATTVAGSSWANPINPPPLNLLGILGL